MIKILLADDSVTIQKVVELTFSDGESEVMAFGDGASAFEKAQLERPDIILSDVIMPGMNGYELCQKIKTDPGLKTVPFLFLKGTFESFDEEKAKACGADGFIVKPFESQELIGKVKELLEGAGAEMISPAAPQDAPPPEAVRPPAVTEPPPAAPPAAAPPPPPQTLHTPPPAEEWPAPQEPAPGGPEAMGLREISAEPPREAAPEGDDDLWSEVSLRESTSPLADDKLLEEESFWGTAEEMEKEEEPSPPSPRESESYIEEVEEQEILDLAEESVLEAPMPLSQEIPFMGEMPEEGGQQAGAAAVPVEEIPPGDLSPSPEPVPEFTPPVSAPSPSVETGAGVEEEVKAVRAGGADLEKAVGARIEEAVSAHLGPVIAETARKIIEEVAWEVIPDLAEAMIKSEIEKIRQKGM